MDIYQIVDGTRSTVRIKLYTDRDLYIIQARTDKRITSH